MQQRVLKQNPNIDGIVAGAYIKAKVNREVSHFAIDDGLKFSSSSLQLELPVQLPVDFTEYVVKLEYTSGPVFFYNFELVGRFGATVEMWAPMSQPQPTEVLIYALEPILMRGIKEPQAPTPVKAPEEKKKKGKKK